MILSKKIYLMKSLGQAIGMQVAIEIQKHMLKTALLRERNLEGFYSLILESIFDITTNR